MNGFVLFTIAAALYFDVCAATYGPPRVVAKSGAAAYKNPNAVYALPPPPPAPPATVATTYRYDIRYNPAKYGYAAPPYPASVLPPNYPSPADYVLPYPLTSYASPVPVPAYASPVPVPAYASPVPVPAYTSPVPVPAYPSPIPVPAYKPPGYSPAHAHHFIDRHFDEHHHHHHHHH